MYRFDSLFYFVNFAQFEKYKLVDKSIVLLFALYYNYKSFRHLLFLFMRILMKRFNVRKCADFDID